MSRRPVGGVPEGTEHVTFVPFLGDGRCVLVREPSGAFTLPAGDLLEGEDVMLDATLRIPLMTAGFRSQHFHPFAADGPHLFAWIEGDRYAGRRPHVKADLVISTAAESCRRLIAAGRDDLAEIVEEAAGSRSGLSEADFYADNVSLLERAYLRADTPEGGSGYGGTSEEWRINREHIVQGIDHAGTFLDIGCANGLLMEFLVAWAEHHIEPYGVDLAPGLVALARRRLPQWADRIWLGNAIDWEHPAGMRFDFVHVGIRAVPVTRHLDLVEHLLAHVVAPRGRLLVSHYVDPAVTSEPRAAEILSSLGFAVAGESAPPPDARTARTAWVVAPRARP